MTDRGYARISLDTQESGSIVKQVSRITAFGGNDIEWYKDESVSGSKIPFAERPHGGRLLADLQPGDRVLVTKIDRAARSVKDLLNLVERIEAAGASIVFVDQNIDTSGPMGRFILVLLGAIAELEASIIAERRRESLESFAAEGRHAVGKAPFGFHSVPNPNGRGLVIRVHPEQGPILRDAIERVMKGETQESLAEELGMSKPGFNRLLFNPRLAGMTPVNGGVVTIDGTPRIDPEAAILSMAEWTRLQSMLKTGRGWNKHDGIGAALTCATCGGRLYYAAPGSRAWDQAGYKCARTAPEHKEQRIPSASITVARAEEYVERVFLDMFGDQKAVVQYFEDSGDDRTEAVSIAKVQLQEVRRRQDEAVTDEEEEALLVEYRAAKRALRDAEALPMTRRMVTMPTGRTVGEEWRDADPAQRVLMLKLAGDWLVQPGRLPIDEKITLKPRLVGPEDMEQVKARLTPLS